MNLRILHTADWHLGHSLHGVSREYEHARFLDWLLDELQARRADVLIVAGDLFDSANPPASAQATLYRFVVQAGRRMPRLQMVMIAGNHDSAGRLEAPSPILDALRVRVVGAVRRGPDGAIDTSDLLIPLEGPHGEVAAWCAAVPFLRPSDLRTPDPSHSEAGLEPGDGGDPLVAGVARLYAEVLEATTRVAQPGQALITLGHCYLVGTRLSELSERKILGGNQHALPVSLFPGTLDYVALGHLHLAQTVGGRANVRYSGSPIPLSLDERRYCHQVIQVDLEAGAPAVCEPVAVPRFVDILRFPETGTASIDELEAALTAHAFDASLPPERHPFLEVAVRLERPDPGLRHRIERVLDDRPARLLKLSTQYPGRVTGLHTLPETPRLDELQPDGVFRERYRQRFESDPPAPLMEAFHQLLESIQGDAS